MSSPLVEALSGPFSLKPLTSSSHCDFRQMLGFFWLQKKSCKQLNLFENLALAVSAEHLWKYGFLRVPEPHSHIMPHAPSPEGFARDFGTAVWILSLYNSIQQWSAIPHSMHLSL